MKTSLVITTINKLNKNLRNFVKICEIKNWDLYIIGDRKTPIKSNNNKDYYYDINRQHKTKFKFAKICPENTYSRKNIGYLLSYINGNKIIVETDDDNIPYKKFFSKVQISHKVKKIKNKSWINIYDLFKKKKDEELWPRGLPLDELFKNKINLTEKKINKNFLLQQGVSEINPDVDAIFRFSKKKINIRFKDFKVSLGKSLSPFNSQNTIWHKSLLPIMYLPVTCTMRCTDIWRALIALKILQINNSEILFFGTTMYQIRNQHDLFKDFSDEIPAYLNNKRILHILNKIKLKKGEKFFSYNLKKCYDELIKKQIFISREKIYLNAWLKDCKKIIS